MAVLQLNATGIQQIADSRQLTAVIGGRRNLKAGLSLNLPAFNAPASIRTFGGFDVRTGDIEQARLDLIERLKRVKASKGKSRVNIANLFGDGSKQKNILEDVI